MNAKSPTANQWYPSNGWEAPTTSMVTPSFNVRQPVELGQIAYTHTFLEDMLTRFGNHTYEKPVMWRNLLHTQSTGLLLI